MEAKLDKAFDECVEAAKKTDDTNATQATTDFLEKMLGPDSKARVKATAVCCRHFARHGETLETLTLGCCYRERSTLAPSAKDIALHLVHVTGSK